MRMSQRREWAQRYNAERETSGQDTTRAEHTECADLASSMSSKFLLVTYTSLWPFPNFDGSGVLLRVLTFLPFRCYVLKNVSLSRYGEKRRAHRYAWHRVQGGLVEAAQTRAGHASN